MKIDYDYTGNELYGLTLTGETELDKEILMRLSTDGVISTASEDVTVPGEVFVNIRISSHINIETELKLKK